MEQTRFHTRFMTLGMVMLVAGGIMLGSNWSPQSYFYGWVFWTCVTFGCFALSLLHHMTKGSWGYPIMRLLEAGGGWRMLTLFGLLSVPVATLWLRDLYPWTQPEVAALPKVAVKMGFLNSLPVATLAIFLVLIFWSYRNETWQRKEDETGDLKFLRWRTNWSSGFFPFFVLIVNFAFTLWVMSMKPEWFSTMYGIWFLVQQGLSAMAIMAIIVGTQSRKEPFKEVFTSGLTRDIGNLMLTMTLLWAYFSFSQYLIIWSGNLPETNTYWLDRRTGGFENLGALLIALGFFVPFLLLLFPSMKRDPKKLATVGWIVLLGRLLDIHYNVTPMFRTSVVPTLGDLGGLIAFGGLWCLFYGVFVQSRSLVLKYQPQLAKEPHHA